MLKFTRRIALAVAAVALSSGVALAQSKVSIAVGGASCLCYLPTVLAKQLGEYEKAGVNVELIEFKGGSDALKAVMGGSADVVSGYFDHCVNLAAKKQHLQSFVVYDRYPGFALVVSPKHQEGRRQRARLVDRLLPEIHAQESRCGSEFGRRYRRRARRFGHRIDGERRDRSRHHARSGRDSAGQQEQGPQDPERHALAEGHA
jgi:hypothetical protein